MVGWSAGAVLAAGLLGWAAGYPEMALGVGAPVLAVVSSWAAMKRAWASSPASLMPLLMRTFATKSVFYLAYVVVVFRKIEIRPEPFVASLVAAFIVLNVVQAWALKRLMDEWHAQGRN